MNVAAKKIEAETPQATLICVQPERAGEVWPTVAALIDSAFAATDESIPEDILPRLAAGFILLWLVVDASNKVVAAMTTTLIRTRSGKVCKMVACGGTELDLWKDFHLKIEDYARTEGCTSVKIEGRPGWQKVLDGFKQTAVVLEKRL